MTAFNIAQAQTANKMLELADLTAGQASVDDMMLTEAQQQTALLTSINDSYVPQQNNANNNVIMLEEVKATNARLIESIKRTNELMQTQNRLQAETADNVDKMANNGVEISA
jgi:hypothetical protein